MPHSTAKRAASTSFLLLFLEEPLGSGGAAMHRVVLSAVSSSYILPQDPVSSHMIDMSEVWLYICMTA